MRVREDKQPGFDIIFVLASQDNDIISLHVLDGHTFIGEHDIAQIPIEQPESQARIIP